MQMASGRNLVYHKEDELNLAIQVKDARGRPCWDYRGQIITEPMEGAKPLELRHIVADALGQDKDGPFRPRILLGILDKLNTCLLYTSPSPRDRQKSRMPS